MRTIYIAEDGKVFDDEYKCELYEHLVLEHPSYLNIKMENLLNHKFYFPKDFDNPLNDNIYNFSFRVFIENKNQLEDLAFFADYCGWCEFKKINSIGNWKWSFKSKEFIKSEE